MCMQCERFDAYIKGVENSIEFLAQRMVELQYQELEYTERYQMLKRLINDMEEHMHQTTEAFNRVEHRDDEKPMMVQFFPAIVADTKHNLN